MKLTAEQYADALAKGFKPYWHKVDGFAEACVDTNSYREVCDCKTARVDQTDCRTWGISEDEWREAQVQAIELAMAHYDDEQ